MKTAQDTLKLGFIGGGISSVIGHTHYSACQIDSFFEVVSGAFSREHEINQKTADFYKIPSNRCYDDWREMIKHEKSNLDAIVVLSPSPMHCEVICVLLENNIPIICEKPLSMSEEELDKIKQVYQPNKHFLLVTYNYSGYPMIRELKDRVTQGNIGKVSAINIEMPQDTFVKQTLDGERYLPQAWRLNTSQIPMICLDLGVHIHHLLFFILGQEPLAIMSMFHSSPHYEALIDGVHAWLKYKENMYANIMFSKNSFGDRNELKIHVLGHKGALTWQHSNPEKLQLSEPSGTQIMIDRSCSLYEACLPRYDRMKIGHPSGYIEAFANLYVDIADALFQWKQNGSYDNPYVFGLEHASEGISLFNKASLSHELAQWVALNND